MPCSDSPNNQYADDCEQKDQSKPVQVASRGKYFSDEDSGNEERSSCPMVGDHGDQPNELCT
jgi:hypothetical protein